MEEKSVSDGKEFEEWVLQKFINLLLAKFFELKCRSMNRVKEEPRLEFVNEVEEKKERKEEGLRIERGEGGGEAKMEDKLEGETEKNGEFWKEKYQKTFQEKEDVQFCFNYVQKISEGCFDALQKEKGKVFDSKAKIEKLRKEKEERESEIEENHREIRNKLREIKRLEEQLEELRSKKIPQPILEGKAEPLSNT